MITIRFCGQIGPALDAASRGLAVPKDRGRVGAARGVGAVGGLGSLNHLIGARRQSPTMSEVASRTSTTSSTFGFIDSQVNSGNEIARWAASLNTLALQTAQTDPALRSSHSQRARPPDQVNATFGDVRGVVARRRWPISRVVIDMLKRYHNGVEAGVSVLHRSPRDRPVGLLGSARPDWCRQLARSQPPA